MSPEIEVSFASALTWSSARFRSRSTPCACSWSSQKPGCAILSSSLFNSSRKCAASKKAPHKRDALLQSFVSVLQIFQNHFVSLFAFRYVVISLLRFFTNVRTTRITETMTHNQANQSPIRVYNVKSVLKSYV